MASKATLLGVNDLRDLAPALSDRMVGADFVPAEGYGDPLRGMMALIRLTRQHGGRLLRGAEVRSIEQDGVGWIVRTSKGNVKAGHVVNAAGPWAARIGRMVGLDLPVTGTVQQVIVTEPAPALTQASGRRSEPASVVEAAGERRIADRRRLVWRV